MDGKVANLMDSGGWFMPESITKMSAGVDGLFDFILWASIIVFVALIAAVIYFIKTGKAKNHEAHVTHNDAVEIAWTIIPTIIVMIIFYFGFVDFIKMKVPPGNAMQVHVTAKKWQWQFDYSNGTKALNELVVPVNVPVELIMSSEDVLHSFFLPNLRMKRDIVPNRYTTIWFNAEKTGQYHIFCTEYCGDGHSNMLAVLRVLPLDEFEEWLETGGGADESTPLPELGKRLYTSKGCNACHSLDGSAAIGPSWKGLAASKRPLVGGGSAVADENYLRESIVDPNKQVVAGYAPVMPTYSGMLRDRELNAIIEFIKTLKD